MAFISIVSPVYKTGKMVPAFIEQLEAAMEAVSGDYEIILVDDGSPDDCWQWIAAACHKNEKLRGIRLSRNFGQHYAITAGLDHCKGEWIVVMDSDLQDKPSEIKRLYEESRKGFDIVIARRQQRRDNLLRKAYSRFFYFLLSKLSGITADNSVATFGIYHSRVIKVILSMKENNRFFPMMVNWVGFNKAYIDVEHGLRAEGDSGYDFRKLLKLALNTTLAYSDKPLQYVVRIGFFISFFTAVYGCIVLFRYFTGRIVVLGYTSLLLSIWFLGGIILFTLGMVGLYVGKTFEGIKNRPLYIIDKTLN